MVRYVPDRTGRFFERPHYEAKELDTLCEKMISDFFKKLGREVPLPIPTEDLIRLIEQDVSEFDGFADLSKYGKDVEGITEFLTGRKPRVGISAALAEDERRENRYRTTLTHELGHVRLHAYLFELERPRRDLAGAGRAGDRIQICKRDTMVTAAQSDWMEWQAGHICGAVLMPATSIKKIAGDYQHAQGIFGPVSATGEHGRALVETAVKTFQVSADAARVRLSRLGYLGAERGPSLFSI
jgi:hypothetical protein